MGAIKHIWNSSKTAIPIVDYVSRLQATNDLNSEIYYSVESTSALSAYIRMKNGYGVRHKYLKDGNGFWVNSTYELGKINSNKNYTSETGTWNKADNGNYYTSQVGATITVTFTGTSISLRHRSENSNAGMAFVIDGDSAHPAYALATGATGDKTTVLFTGLSDTTHTMVGTFSGGGSRFFVKYNTGLSGFDTETFIITGSVNNWNPGAYQLKSVSNIEIAYTQKKFGAAYAETFFPYHTAVTSANTTTAFTVDGNALSVASVIPFTQCNELIMHQIANVFNNSAPAEITGVCDMLYTINRTGVKVDFSINFPQKTSIEKGYPFMHVVLPANMSKLHYNDNGGVLLSSLNQSGVNTIVGSDAYRSYMFESSANGVGCAMTFNNTNALRLDKSDRVTPLCWIQKTAVDKWKLYPQAFLNATIEANTTYTGSATYYIGII